MNIKILSKITLLLSFLHISLAEERLKIVTTFLPIFAHTQSIVGDLADVHCLISSGGDPHSFQFKSSDIKKLSEADLIIENGVGIETWLNPILKRLQSQSGPQLKSPLIIDTSLGIPLLENREIIHQTKSENNNPKSHSQTGDEKNPHLWLDPQNAKLQTLAILKGLIQADPRHRADYTRKADLYLAELDRLDNAFTAETEKLHPKNLITLHDAFLYLAHRYGFHYLGCVEASPEKNPTPQTLKKLIDLIRENRVTTLFVENGYSPHALTVIARETGAKIAILDTIEIGTPEPDAYLKRMYKNLEALKTAWGKN